jgi:NAD(P)-dependent dehydrogenase (short-subunit alcohol dehydrogenase family)
MKTYLSIGSGPGIGIATAERFAAEGFRVVLTSRDAKSLKSRAEHGYEVDVNALDSGDLASVEGLVRDTEAKFGSIDVLHFNAASMRPATIDTQAPDTFVPDLTINVGAALVATQAASRGMLSRGSGCILITGGIFALTPNPDYLSLSVGKAGLRAMVLGLFEPFRQQGVHIATVTVAALVASGSADAR